MSRLNQGGIGILLIVLFLIGYVVGACGKENIAACESIVTDTEKALSTKKPKSAQEAESAEQWEKGYDLPVEEH